MGHFVVVFLLSVFNQEVHQKMMYYVKGDSIFNVDGRTEGFVKIHCSIHSGESILHS